ncbi:hypothetical protein DICPUDRAFT_41582 [Dictyostelium purpureum]|uniref:ATP phosphoribosyltransferase n=1 Tax=Dictyostelium purpureum TaxID=5786 RepID=F1A0E0_DICPU|nr:uncharacterized protein DICPUDRAFT_41582 [Dictyostelium purpureum]EGC30335.1 hypothetical protein DICPUDRAFT_41582 [Dictyostelium purpureum]|eukprot:XP_003293132.1 hypothetical protein DICPUDRAFT_41582 [Dictyostelium purpureum]
MYKIIFFVPKASCDIVKTSMFKVGAGRMGGYDSCCFVSSGMGQFRPLQGSNPTIGNIGNIEYVEEYKVEMVCDDNIINDAIKALKESHPYEVPAYEVYKLLDL